jgi:16S rRNA (guanine966-N2)-methyltransferase
MRVIAGQFRSRTLRAPSGMATRPTSDRLRETLFNVVAPRIEGALFLDLYAGSGAVGIEALSRGAAEAAFIERAPEALAALRANLDLLGIRSTARLWPGGVGAVLRRRGAAEAETRRFDLVFLDPPYDALGEYGEALTLLEERGWLAAGALVIAEHRRKQPLQEQYGLLQQTRMLRQGDAGLTFYSVR